ncbi:MAG: NAD-dependent epimerase/dehydratase family protein [Gemmatimonadota bacterium]
MTTRRDFLRQSLLYGSVVGAGGLSPIFASAGGEVPPEPGTSAGGRKPGSLPRKSLNVLVLGGTGFIGPHLVHELVSRGHQVSTFTRGRSEPRLHADSFRSVVALVGDRDGDLTALEGRRWDVVVDNSGYTPQQVRDTARLLAGNADQYIFTSTRAVYADFTHDPMDEDAPLGIPDVPESEWTGYGPLKALAEQEVRAAFPRGTAIVRPPIITGPGDTTDRFTFWYQRVDEGGEILAPGAPDDPIQYVDVRDLVEFVVHLAETGQSDVYNVEAPASPLTTGAFLHGLRATTGSALSFTWVDWDFLEEHGLRGGAEIAAWRAPRGADLNYGRMDNRRAIAAGMTFRPLALTAMDTRDWWRGTGGRSVSDLGSGHSREREAEILANWHGR